MWLSSALGDRIGADGEAGDPQTFASLAIRIQTERNGRIKIGITEDRKLPKDDAVQRYKCFGEMSAKELWETTMDPANRVLMQVTLDDTATVDELFSVLMDEDVESRRSFITRNAKDARLLDV